MGDRETPVSTDETQILRFLFDKRLELFNVRRDHEWRVVIGAIVLIGAVDYALVTLPISLDVPLMGLWTLTLLFLFVAIVCYEFGIQERNRIDRLVMDEIGNRLASSIRLPEDSSIRCLVDAEKRVTQRPENDSLSNHTYLWAFLPQVAVLLMACVVSWILPLKISPAEGQSPAPLRLSNLQEATLLGAPLFKTLLAIVAVVLAALWGWLWHRCKVNGPKVPSPRAAARVRRPRLHALRRTTRLRPRPLPRSGVVPA